MKYLSWTGLQHFYDRYISPLKEVARTGRYDDLLEKPEIVNNTTTTKAGTILDGRVGRTLKENIDKNQEDFDTGQKKQNENISNIWKNLDQLNGKIGTGSTIQFITVRQKVMNMPDADLFAVTTINELLNGKINDTELDRLYIQAQNADETANPALIIATTMRPNGQVIVKLNAKHTGQMRISFLCATTFVSETRKNLEKYRRLEQEIRAKTLLNRFDEHGNMIIPDAIDANTLDPNGPAVEII